MSPRSFIILVLVLWGVFYWANEAEAAESRVYLGLHWIHLSNVDAGIPFNDDHEDNADHIGAMIEWQLVHPNDDYFHVSLGIGETKANTRYQSGWDCSGCRFNSSLIVGYKWRIH